MLVLDKSFPLGVTVPLRKMPIRLLFHKSTLLSRAFELEKLDFGENKMLQVHVIFLFKNFWYSGFCVCY